MFGVEAKLKPKVVDDIVIQYALLAWLESFIVTIVSPTNIFEIYLNLKRYRKYTLSSPPTYFSQSGS